MSGLALEVLGIDALEELAKRLQFGFFVDLVAALVGDGGTLHDILGDEHGCAGRECPCAGSGEAASPSIAQRGRSAAVSR